MNDSEIRSFLELMRPTETMKARTGTPRGFDEIVREVEMYEWNGVIVRLFEHAGLDYHAPDAWYVMMGYFAEVLFDLQKTPGAPAKWKRPSASMLRRDLADCVARNSRLNGMRLCEKMKAQFPQRYDPDLPASTILRWLSVAGISIKTLKRKSKVSRESEKI